VACLALEVVALYLDVAQPHLKAPLSVAQCGNLFLQGALCVVGLGLALLVLGLG